MLWCGYLSSIDFSFSLRKSTTTVYYAFPKHLFIYVLYTHHIMDESCSKVYRLDEIYGYIEMNSDVFPVEVITNHVVKHFVDLISYFFFMDVEICVSLSKNRCFVSGLNVVSHFVSKTSKVYRLDEFYGYIEMYSKVFPVEVIRKITSSGCRVYHDAKKKRSTFRPQL